MSDESCDKRSGSRTGLVVAALLALTLYILSPLPVVMAMEKWFGLSMHGPGETWFSTAIHVVYYPLVKADEHVPAVREFYQAYGRLIGYP
jgi:hypothetical protein